MKGNTNFQDPPLNQVSLQNMQALRFASVFQASGGKHEANARKERGGGGIKYLEVDFLEFLPHVGRADER